MIDVSLRRKFGRKLGREDITEFGEKRLRVGIWWFRESYLCINGGKYDTFHLFTTENLLYLLNRSECTCDGGSGGGGSV